MSDPNSGDQALTTNRIDATEASLSYSESYVRSLLAKNLHRYFPEKLRLVQEEYSITGIGRIDILAADIRGGFVAIEIKKVIATRDAVGQLASYVGALTGSHKGKSIRGYLVAPAFDDASIAASKLVPQIQLLKMDVTLDLSLSSPTGQMPTGFLPQEKPPPKWQDRGRDLPWTLNVSEMRLSSILPFVSTTTIDDQHIVAGKGVNTNWGFVPFSEISLEGGKGKLAEFVRRHRIKKSPLASSNASRGVLPGSRWPFPSE